MDPLEHILGTQHQRIKQWANAAKNHPEDQIQPQGIDRRIAELTNLDNRFIAVEDTENDGGHNHAGKYGFNGDQVVAKLRAHLFNNKQNPGERRVKGGGEPRRGAGRQKRMARFRATHAEHVHHHTPKVAPKLDHRPFASQHHSRAQRTHAADKLHRQHAPPADGTQLFQRAFNFRDPGAARFRRKTPHEEIAHHCQQSGEYKGQRPHQKPVVSHLYQRANTQVLHPVDAFLKRDADQPRQRSDNGGH